jgi:Transposase, Mutator family
MIYRRRSSLAPFPEPSFAAATCKPCLNLGFPLEAGASFGPDDLVVGVNSDGLREVLGMDIGSSETEAFWTVASRRLIATAPPLIKHRNSPFRR